MANLNWTVLLMLGALSWQHPASSLGAAAGGAREHQPCGGETGVVCDEGLWCDVKGACDDEYPAGVCVRIPGTCPKDRAPVCGCDGVTYQNDCDRLVHKMQEDHDGECTDEPEDGEDAAARRRGGALRRQSKAPSVTPPSPAPMFGLRRSSRKSYVALET